MTSRFDKRRRLDWLRPLVNDIQYLYMKTIQITVDEGLLKGLDSAPETKRDGRSAVIRRALGAYLKKRRNEAIDEKIRRGYAKKGFESELEGWAEEVVWLDD